jgi:hypothetical protein
MKRLGILLLGLGFLAIGLLTATETGSEIIRSEGVLNEMTFFVLNCLIGIVCIWAFFASEMNSKTQPKSRFVKSSKGFLCSRL